MSEQTHTVRFEPVGIEMEVREGETVLDAAFRQGISLAHGCKEGQCSSCKSIVSEGIDDIEMLKYSTFALPEQDRDTNHVLLCRTHVYADITVELLNYDEDLLSRSIAVKEFPGKVVKVEALTHDIRLLEVELESPIKFWSGQYVDLKIVECGTTRAYSMSNRSDGSNRISFIIKKYPDGAFSSKLDGGLQPGHAVVATGPYGTCFRREGRPGPMLLVGGGSGMSPLRAILSCHLASGEQRPIRFFYGARTKADLFLLDEFAEIAAKNPDFKFIPALSDEKSEDWDGERGMIHEVVARHMQSEQLDGEIDAYSCGPPPMIDAVMPVLQMAGVQFEHIHFDKFTQPSR